MSAFWIKKNGNWVRIEPDKKESPILQTLRTSMSSTLINKIPDLAAQKRMLGPFWYQQEGEDRNWIRFIWDKNKYQAEIPNPQLPEQWQALVFSKKNLNWLIHYEWQDNETILEHKAELLLTPDGNLYGTNYTKIHGNLNIFHYVQGVRKKISNRQPNRTFLFDENQNPFEEELSVLSIEQLPLLPEQMNQKKESDIKKEKELVDKKDQTEKIPAQISPEIMEQATPAKDTESRMPLIKLEINNPEEEIAQSAEEEETVQSAEEVEIVQFPNEEKRTQIENSTLIKNTISKINTYLNAFELKISTSENQLTEKGDRVVKELLVKLRSLAEEYNKSLEEVVNFNTLNQKLTTEYSNLISQAFKELENDLEWGDYILNLGIKIINALIFVFSLGTQHAFFSPIEPYSTSLLKALKTEDINSEENQIECSI